MEQEKILQRRLIKDNIQDEDNAKAIQDIGGTLPEEIATQEKRNINLLGNLLGNDF